MSRSVSYDEQVIVQFAQRLYRRAASRVAAHVVLGAALGALSGAAAAYAAHSTDAMALAMLAIAIAGGLLGWLVGSERAFALRLMAQSALCQVRIERNTRAALDAPPSLPYPVGNAGAYPLPTPHRH